MSSWTRANDAWIARECEGLEVSDLYGSEWHEIRSGRPWKPVDSYSTDPAAAIRAAEAWKVKDENTDRTITLTAAIEGLGTPCTAELAENYPVGNDYKWRTFEGQASENDEHPWAAALAQALYRATGGGA